MFWGLFRGSGNRNKDGKESNSLPSSRYREPKQRYAIVDTDGHITWDVNKEWIERGTEKGKEYLEYDRTIRTHKNDMMHIYRYIR